MVKVDSHAFDFAITSFCQAKCRSCVRTNPRTGDTVHWLTPEHMKIEVFDKILNNSTTVVKNLDHIRFCGELGDPLMHPEIDQFIDSALEYTDKLVINTNGGLRQPRWYSHIADKYQKKIFIEWGIDGTDHDTNWLYREGVDWKRAVDNMTTWFENGGIGKWHFLIFEWNWQQIPEALEMSKEIGCRIDFKLNHREHGKISDNNKDLAFKLLEENGVL